MIRWLPALLLAGCHAGHDPDQAPGTAGDEAAECCLRAKLWEARDDGWGSPRMETITLAPGEFKEAPLTLIKDLHFRFEACGDPTVSNVDLLLYDKDGELVVRDDQPGREPRMTWVAPTRGQRKLLVYLRETTTGKPASVAWYWASNTDE